MPVLWSGKLNQKKQQENEMRIIYEPKGAAREYGELAANIYKGCSHGCLYCYAPAATFKKRASFINSELRVNIINALRKEIPEYLGREIFLCFTCDLYQQLNDQFNVARIAIDIIGQAGAIPIILTKGGKRSENDFDLLKKYNGKYGATLTFINDSDSKKWEPSAALPKERFAALKTAHAMGIKTWASLEPVIDPDQSLKIIDTTHGYVDFYKIGKWNHDKRAKGINWKKFVEDIVCLLKSYDKEFYIKNDLKKEMDFV